MSNNPPILAGMNRSPRSVGFAVVLGFTIGLVISIVQPADAARNASGTYSLPTGNPVTAGNTITASWANTTLTDLGSEITNSLDRNGKGAMLAPLQCVPGSVSAPGVTFSNDSDTGVYRIGANNPGMAAGGVKAQEWATTGATFPLAVTIAGVLTADGGVVATNSTTNSDAITATGNGTGQGGDFTGGASSGSGIDARGGAPNGLGGHFQGTGTGVGAQFQAGTASTATDPTNAIALLNGNLTMSGVTEPNKDEPFTDTLTPSSMIKAWGLIAVGTGTPSVTVGFNVASVSCAASTVTVNLASAFSASAPTSSTNWAVFTEAFSSTHQATGVVTDADTFTIIARTAADGVQVDLCAAGSSIRFLVLGIQ